jgi:hypothetical protein
MDGMGWSDWLRGCMRGFRLTPYHSLPGKHKEKTYDPERKLCMLLPAWVSRASAIQRKGT